jgi:hypothetical protein
MGIQFGGGGDAAAVVDVPYVASDFGGTGGMTWTVDPGDVVTFKTCVIGRLMIIWLTIATSTIGGVVAGQSLTLKIPQGRRLANSVSDFARWTNATFSIDSQIKVEGAAGANILTFRNIGGGDFQAGVNDTGLLMTFPIPLQ